MARRVSFTITAKNKGFLKALDQSAKRMDQFGRKMQRTGANLTKMVTVPVLAAGAGAVKIASDFESSFADIRKTVNATEGQFSALESEIRNLSKTIPTSVEELNRLGGVAGQLGVGRENLVEFTKTIAMLGDTTDVAGEQAALSLSRFMNVMGTAQGDIDRVGSTIVGLGNNFAAMESEIIETATSLAAFGSQMGLSESQVLAFSTAIAASGGKTEAAATAFQKTASTMQQAVIEGNKDLKTFADVAGVSSEAFAKAFRDNAAGALQLFLRGLKRVSDEGLSTASVLDELGLADQRLQREFGKLIGNLDQLDDALVQANVEWEKNTALTEEAQKRYGTFQSKIQIFRNRLKDLAISLGNTLIPFIELTMEKFEDMIKPVETFGKRLESLSKESKIQLMKIVAAAILVPPAIWAIGTAIRGVALTIAILTAPITGLLVLFGSVVATGQWFVDNFDIITARFEKNMLIIEQAATHAMIGVINAFKSFFNFATTLAPPELFTGLFGIDLSEMALDFVGVNKILDELNQNVDRNEKEMKGTLIRAGENFGTFADSAKNALELTKNAIMAGLKGILDDSAIAALFAELDEKFNMEFSTGTTGGCADNIGKMSIGIKNLKTVSESYLDGLKKRMSDSSFWEQFRIQIDKTSTKWQDFKDKFEAIGGEFKAFLAGEMSSAVLSFGDALGRSLAGAENEWQTTFEKITMVVLDFAKSLARLAAGIGGVMLFIPGFQGAGAGLLAAAAALQAAISFGQASIQKNASARQQRSVNDALIRSDGSIVNFHPDDNILAMRDFGQLGGGGATTIMNQLNLDGRVVWKNQKTVTHRRSR